MLTCTEWQQHGGPRYADLSQGRHVSWILGETETQETGISEHTNPVNAKNMHHI